MNKYKLISHTRNILADTFTPVNIYTQLRDHYPNALLLESADYHDRSDSKSFICLEPYAGFEAKGKTYSYILPDRNKKTINANSKADVFVNFQNFVNSFSTSADNNTLATHGLWGYSSFESVEYLEDIELHTTRQNLKDNPDLKYQLFRYVLVLDHFKNELSLTQHDVADLPVECGIDDIIKIIRSNESPDFSFQSLGDETTPMSDDVYKNIVARGIDHCQKGDTFQLVLSREFQQKYRGDDFKLYRCLRSVSPSPYLFYFDYGDFKIMGSSPESQLQVKKGVASINPIAGTVKRGNTKEEDLILAEELTNNTKEKSEHIMLVDLARNDLSKNADQIQIDRLAEIQYFSHVIHMVSKISGTLMDDVSGLEMYRDTFPAGTLSGAPKYRAMQLIAELEKTSRNFYGGALGFIGFDGDINHAIIIRSILCKNNTLIYQAGAGVVAQSSPEGELQEVFNKTSSIRNAISKANSL